MVKVGDPFQISCGLCPRIYRHFDVCTEPDCGVVLPELEIWPALNTWPFGESESDECVCILDAFSRVQICTQYLFLSLCCTIELVHSLGQSCFFRVVVPPHAWVDSRDELEGYSQLGKGSNGDVISWIGCGVAAVPF